MKLSNIKDTADSIIHYLNHLITNPLDPKYNRDLLAIINRPLDAISDLTIQERESIDKFVKKEKNFALHLKKIYHGELSLDIEPNQVHINKLNSVLLNRFQYIDGTRCDYTQSAATLFNQPWIKLGNICSRKSNQSTLKVLRGLSDTAVRPMSISFKKFMVEKIKELLLTHLRLPAKTVVDHAVWDSFVQTWTHSFLRDKRWSNEDLSSLYWNKIEQVHFIDFMLPLGCYPSAQFRIKSMHCLASWFCYVMSGYEHIEDLYISNRSLLPANLLLIRDNSIKFKNEDNILNWIELARYLNDSGLRPVEQPILSSTHEAIFLMISQGYRFNEFYSALTPAVEAELTQNMEVHFFNFYHEVYARLPIPERKRLDAHRIVQPGLCKTFGALLQEAIGPRTRYLHVLPSIPDDVFGMEMDYILVGNHLFYVNYIDRRIESVTLLDPAVLKNGIKKIKQYRNSTIESAYKIIFEPMLVKALVTDNGGHAPQRISQACMNNFFKNLLPLLTDYDPFLLFPNCIEILDDPADYFDYSNEEPENLWGNNVPFLLERLRYHSARKVYKDYETLDLVQSRNEIVNLIVLLLSYPFVDTTHTLKFNKLQNENRGPQAAFKLISMLNCLITANADPRFILACVKQYKCKELSAQVSAIELPLNAWDKVSYLFSMGNNYTEAYHALLEAKNDTMSFFCTLSQWKNINKLRLNLNREKVSTLERPVLSIVYKEKTSSCTILERATTPPIPIPESPKNIKIQGRATTPNGFFGSSSVSGSPDCIASAYTPPQVMSPCKVRR